jgi:hypothetical protein
LVGPEQQLIDIAVLMAVHDPDNDVGEVVERICPSSDNLRLIRHFEKGGSGSSGVRV